VRKGKVYGCEEHPHLGLIWRNHSWQVENANDVAHHEKWAFHSLVSSRMDGCLLEARLGNVWMMQHHPERTLEGIEAIEEFLAS
jgi:signal transduction histidine kinase